MQKAILVLQILILVIFLIVAFYFINELNKLSQEIENALEIINTPSSVKLLQYGITNDTAWEVGLACGGDIKIRIDTMKSNG